MKRLINRAGWWRPNLRVLLLTVLFLWILDQIIMAVFDHQVNGEGTFRLKIEEKRVLEGYLEKIEADPHPKVIMIGDSVMFGSAARMDDQTIPAWFHQYIGDQSGGEMHVYNLGLRGLGIADAYYLLKRLQKPENNIEWIVYNINTGWFTRENIINRPFILDLHEPESIPCNRLGLDPPPARDAEGWIQDHIMDKWKLYHYRYLVSHWLFGKPLIQRLQDEANQLYNQTDNEDEEHIYDPWYEKEWDQRFAGDWKIGAIYHGNTQWQYFEYLLQLMKKTSSNSLVFFTPRNGELLEKYDKVDHQLMAKSKQTIRETAHKYGVAIVDYEDLLASSYFSDSIHPLPEGNRIIAEQLAHDMRRLLDHQGNRRTEP
ncbi:MAG: hypothetical protein H0Z33_07520 [Bacillaceae bacterium]|nr:hypothetical protein [Bacillaceae bacterium]